MIDAQTRRRIQVSTDGTAGPYVMVPLDQLPLVREALDRHEIRYWVDSVAISLGGRPAVVVINLGHSGDTCKVQAILDGTA